MRALVETARSLRNAALHRRSYGYGGQARTRFLRERVFSTSVNG